MSTSKYAIFDKMIEGVQVLNPEWKYIYVNDSVTKHNKYTREELLGFTIQEKYPGIEQTKVYEYLERCMEQGIAGNIVTEFEFPDKSIGYFEVRVQRVDDGIIIFSFDITDVKRAEKLIENHTHELEQMVQQRTAELEKSERRFLLAVAGTSAGVWDWTVSQGSSEWWSPKFYELLGYSNEEIPPDYKSYSEIVHPDDFEYVNARLDAHIKNGKKFEVEYRLKTKTGDYKWFLGNGQAEWDDKGNPLRMVGTIIDIDAKRKAEEMLQERTAELERKNKELEEFVYVASHDLQEPVRTIASFVELFAEVYKDKVDEEGNRMLEFMKGATERSQNLIVDLLDYSRLGKNKEMQAIPLDVLLKEVQADLATKIANKGATISIQPMPTVYGLRTELRLLFQNLISNAIKFSKPNEVPLVTVSAQQLDNGWQFSIKDNGIGFDPKYKEKIFEVFKRLNNRRDYAGTGIGLAQCKRIVELHKGDIWAESVEGEGSTFYFTLHGDLE